VELRGDLSPEAGSTSVVGTDSPLVLCVRLGRAGRGRPVGPSSGWVASTAWASESSARSARSAAMPAGRTCISRWTTSVGGNEPSTRRQSAGRSIAHHSMSRGGAARRSQASESAAAERSGTSLEPSPPGGRRVEPDDEVGRGYEGVGLPEETAFGHEARLLQDPGDHRVPFRTRPRGPAFIHEGQRIQVVMGHAQEPRQATAELWSCPRSESRLCGLSRLRICRPHAANATATTGTPCRSPSASARGRPLSSPSPPRRRGGRRGRRRSPTWSPTRRHPRPPCPRPTR
jgi:hypothetical protein